MAENELKPNYSSSSAEEDEEEVSGSEEEESSGSEVSDSDSDQKKPIIESSSQISIKPDLSSESEESGSDSDSDSPPTKPVISDPNIKPISSKPMEPEQLVKTESKTPPPAKRPATVTSPASEKDLKKPKTNNTVDDDTKKQLFQRLWSEDDEIVILKGMIDYKTAKNESPSGDMGAFHEFIKKSLHVDVSRAQLVDKIRRLKRKFVNNVGREKNGKDRMFSKSHEQKGYELSKLIWGSDSFSTGTERKKNGNANNKGNLAGASTSVKSNGLDYKEVSMMDVEKSMDISRFVQYGRNYDGPVLTEEIMKGGFESLEGSERVEMEEKWKDLKKQELELFVKRMDLLKQQAVRVLEAVNSLR